MHKLKKLLYTTLAGVTLGVTSAGCSWKSAGYIYIEEPPSKSVRTVPIEERESREYKLENIVNSGSTMEVTAYEKRSRYQVYKDITTIKTSRTGFDVQYNPTEGLVKITLLGSLLFGTGLVIGPAMGLIHELDDNGILVQGGCEFLRGEAKARYEIDKTKQYKDEVRNVKLVELQTTSKEEIIESVEYVKQSGNSTVERARNIKLIARPEYLFDNHITNTDENGIGTFRLNDGSNSNFYTSKESLEQKLKRSVIRSSRNVEEKFRNYAFHKQGSVLEELLKSIREINQEVGITTDVTNGINGSIKGSIKLYAADENADYIYARLIKEHIDSKLREYESLINKNINSRIREVTIKLKDIDSHMPLEYAKIEIKSNAPPKRRLAQELVGEDGADLNFAIRRIDDYIIGEDTKTFDEEGVLRFKVYLPSSFDTEIIHKKYNALQQNFKFEEDKLTKTVYMSELGQKMRVKIVDK